MPFTVFWIDFTSWKESESSYKEGELSTFVFNGKVSDGLKFTKLTQTTYNYTDNKPTQEFSYVDNDGNSARLAIQLTIDRAALEGLYSRTDYAQPAAAGYSGEITWK